jgi:type IV pilus assembly protein PilV
MNKRIRQSGMTLIEVLVTVLVVSVGLLGLASLQANSLKEGMDTSKRSQGLWMIDELASRMRVNAAGLANGYTGAGNVATLCNGGAVTQCDSGNECTGNEMARFDVWEVICGADAGAGVIASSNDNINITNYSITCDTAPCDTTSNFTITINWVAKAVQDGTANNSYYNEDDEQNITMTIRP